MSIPPVEFKSTVTPVGNTPQVSSPSGSSSVWAEGSSGFKGDYNM